MLCLCNYAGLVKAFKGKIPMLLRHPSGKNVVDDAYHAATAEQRSAMAAEFYGRQFTLFEVRLRCPAVNGNPLKK